MNKSYRLGQILNVVRTQKVRTQGELVQALRKLNVEATQVTLSRDIRELGLVKTPQGYVVPAAVVEAGPDLDTVVREFLRDVRVAQHTLILQTATGSASPLAEALDKADWPEVIGTIAGDNSVLVVARDNRTAEAVRRKLLDLLQ
ncbi:MAG: ArgR family transcriptional regulator [Acidobacteriota bacterium]